jgi:endonuclease YncB( thermonuclease family)
MRYLGFTAGLFALVGTALAQDVRILDADTIEWQGHQYRLDGVDAPETAQKCLTTDGTPWMCGQAATAALVAFVATKTVTCKHVGTDQKYNRRVGQCFADGDSIEHWLIREGWAIDYVAYSHGRFAASELDATQNRRGIWSSCFTNPRDFRYSDKSAAILMGICPTAPEAVARMKDQLFWQGFAIKAKLFAAGRRLASGLAGIYHIEGCGSYGKMATVEGGKTLFFATADAAEAYGFRKARNCLVR